MGSPPIAGLKKPVTPSLSVSNINRAAAKVGIATNTIKDEDKNAQANKSCPEQAKKCQAKKPMRWLLNCPTEITPQSNPQDDTTGFT